MAKKRKFAFFVRWLYVTMRQYGLTQEEIETLADGFYTKFSEDDNHDAPEKEVVALFDELGDYCKVYETEEETLAHEGWTITCQSPLEIRHKDGAFASHQAARLVIDHICRG